MRQNLDRYGRSYLESGLYRETFRKMGVRFIAVNDAIDTEQGEDYFTPFREVINEFYLREYSKKIKAAYQSRGMAGKHTGSTPPYGYLKSKEDKHQWIVDEEAAAIVKRIFALTMGGNGPYQICKILEAEKVEIPAVHMTKMGVGNHKKVVFEHPYRWSSSTICGILKKREYLGHTVNFKSTKESYKEKRNCYRPESEWVIFENTHPALIEQTTFDNVQRIRGNVKRYPDGWGYVHPLTGLVWCPDCGEKLYCHRIYNGQDKPYYVCGSSTKQETAGVKCTAHRISADALMKLIAETLRAVVTYAREDRTAFEKSIREALATQQTNEVKTQRKQLAKLKKRQAELETLFKRIFEDNALGKLPDNRFESLVADYEKERESIERNIPLLQEAIERFEDGNERGARFAELVKRYENFDELTPTMINEFIEKIGVHERDRKGCINTERTVEIHLNFVGEYRVPEEPTDPETLAQMEEEKRQLITLQDKRHAAYLKRKESGKAQEYEQRYREKKAAAIAAGTYNPRPRKLTHEQKLESAERRKVYSKEYTRQHRERLNELRRIKHAANSASINEQRREKYAAKKQSA